ncbi:MAG TPA: hypothetical protein VLA16_18695 [Ideonella sp.]|nr:hypothetical protein [Ideonella sp.]
MTKLVLAEKDFASGLSVKNIEVPSMKAVVSLDNAELLKDYDKKGEKLILQSLIAAAISGLNDSHKAIKAAIEDFDKRLGKKPPTSLKEAEDELHTFTNTCKQITLAQEGQVTKAVEAAWAMHKKRDKALTKMNLVFSAKIILAAISLAASITAAALSMGTLAITLVGSAKTVVSTALLIKDFAGGRDASAKEVIKIDAALAEDYNRPELKGKVGKAAKEILAAAGVPFLKTVDKLDTQLEDFLGKSARVDDKAQSLYKQANGLMAEIKKIDAKKLGDDNAKQLKQMGDKTDTLLTQIGELVSSVDGDNVFYKVNKARCVQYQTLNGKALTKGAPATTLAVLVAGIAATAKTVVDIALKLA